MTELLIMKDPHYQIMVGCVLGQLKHLELYIRGKSLGLRPRPFPQLRMLSSSGFILYIAGSGLGFFL